MAVSMRGVESISPVRAGTLITYKSGYSELIRTLSHFDTFITNDGLPDEVAEKIERFTVKEHKARV